MKMAENNSKRLGKRVLRQHKDKRMRHGP